MTASPSAALFASGRTLLESPVAFDYDDLSLVPRVVSTLRHRGDASIALGLADLTLKLPLIGSPMPDVCGIDMCLALAGHGALGILHRFQPAKEQVQAWRRAGERSIGAAIGVTGDYRERFTALHEAGCRIFCLDTANGANSQVQDAVAWTRGQGGDDLLIAGNVASAEAFQWLEEQGVDAIRVGIAGGSVCETRTETGVFVPTPYAVAEAAHVRKRALIIGDGGIRTPADMAKLLALGADAVMVGSVLAGTREAPGRVIVVEGKKYKIMRGAASFSVQQESGNREPQYIEGAETMVPYKGGVGAVLERYAVGLRSSLSYMDSRTLQEFRTKARFLLLRASSRD